MDFKKDTFVANVATGNQAITGTGFTPKGILFWTNYQTATGFSDTQGYLFQIGMMDGTNQFSAYGRNNDNVSPNDCDQTSSSTKCIQVRDLTGNDVRRATFVSFDVDGFTINWDLQDGVAAIFHYIAIGGSSVAVACDQMQLFSAPGFSAPNINVNPDLAIFVQNVFSNDSCSFPSIGWMTRRDDGSIQQGVSCAVAVDGVASSDTHRFQRTVRASSILTTAAGGALFNDFGYNQIGFSLETFTSNSNLSVLVFAVSGVKGFATSFLQPVATGNQAVTGSGFTPRGVLFSSVGQTAQTTVQTEARESFGAADGTTQGYGYAGSNNGVNPSVAVGGHSTTNVVVMATPNATGASTSIQAQAALSSLDADGFTVNWGTVDATARQVIALAIGDGASAGTGGEHSAVF